MRMVLMRRAAFVDFPGTKGRRGTTPGEPAGSCETVCTGHAKKSRKIGGS